MWRISLLLMSLIVSMATGADRWSYSLTDNKYGDLLVAISEDVPEDKNIIGKIKAAFNIASRNMLTATKRRAYIGNVTILVPKTWSRNVAWELSGLETFEKANIIIDKINPLVGDNPYVKSQGKCGEPGRYMHLTPRYLTDARYRAEQFGHVGKTIVHEFGHLRWGLYDEYPIPEEGFKGFYHSKLANGSTVVEPVRCSKMVSGRIMHNETGKACTRDPVTSLPEENCRFFPPKNYKHSPAKASLMFWHFMTNTNSFCDNDPSDPSTFHNDEAPNKHNRLCKGRSQWEIMREHEDFRGNNNPPIGDDTYVNTRPSFRVVQKGLRSRLVFVIDISGSMSINNRLQKVTQAAEATIRDAVESGTSVAVVTFETNATTTHAMIPVHDVTHRESLINALPKYTAGSTAIGKGLLEAMEILKNNGGTKGGKIILLSDGQENERPYIHEVLPKLLAAQIIVDTIPLTNEADKSLLFLAAQTGGTTLFSTDSDNSTSVSDAFLQSVTEDSQQSAFVKVFGDLVSLNPNTNYSQDIHIDEDIGNNTDFVITCSNRRQNISALTVRLTSPNGSPIPQPKRDASNSLRYSIPGTAETGAWNLRIENGPRATFTLQLSVTSRQRSRDEKPITLTPELGQSKLDFNDASSRMIIYATLTKGYAPVVDVDVYATVESAKRQHIVKLLDNGAGADTTKEDGVYSAYFLNFDGDGGYAVKVNVQDDSGKARLKTSTAAGQQSAVDLCFLQSNCTTPPRSTPVYTPVKSISRVATAGSFQVVNQPPTSGRPTNQPVDLYEPDDITDLIVTETYHENSTLKLQWTAVGDDLDQGQASRYEFRMNTDLHDLRANFASSSVIDQSTLLKGNLSQPRPAGEVETFVVQLSHVRKEITYFLAMKAYDETHKSGDVSNVVPVAFTVQVPPMEVVVTYSKPKPGEPEVTSSPEGDNTFFSKDVILAMTFGAVAAIVVIVIIISVVVAKGKARAFERRNNKVIPYDNSSLDTCVHV